MIEKIRKIFGIRRDIKKNTTWIMVNKKEIQELKEDNKKIKEDLENLRFFYTVGLSIINTSNQKHINLMLEAKERGFFDKDKHFESFGSGLMKHSPSPTRKNYWYYDEMDSLHISSTGYNGNFSDGVFKIYENGKWGEVFQDKKNTPFKYNFTIR